MKSKTKISQQLKKKKNPNIVETVMEAKKNEKWLRIAEILSSPRKNRTEKNLDWINNKAKENETIVVPGKVLSVGNLDKKLNIVALGFSENAKEKIQKSGSKALTILEEIKKNPDAKNIRILAEAGERK